MSELINTLIRSAFSDYGPSSSTMPKALPQSQHTIRSFQSTVSCMLSLSSGDDLWQKDVFTVADELIEQCRQLVDAASSAMITVPVPASLLQFQAVSRIRQWRSKRRDSRLAAMYEALYPKIKDIEKLLRQVCKRQLTNV